MATWPRGETDPSKRKWWTYQCRSWRHEGDCARWVSQRDYARIMAALEPVAVADLVLVVLTLDPTRAEPTLAGQYQGLQPRWAMLQKYLTRGWLEGAIPAMGRFDFVSVVEQHRSGQPHVNVIIHSPELAAHLREHGPTDGDVAAKRGPRWWRSLVAHCGWGPLSSIGHARSKEDVASYSVKVSKGAVPHPTMVGEVVKLAQLPVAAPPRMRRVRSSKGFLPPARKPPDPEREGGLMLHPTPEVMRQRQEEARAALEATWGTVLGWRPAVRGWWRAARLGHVRILGLRDVEPVLSGAQLGAWWRTPVDAERDAFRAAARGAPVRVPVPPWLEAQRMAPREPPPPPLPVLGLADVLSIGAYRQATRRAQNLGELEHAKRLRPSEDVLEAWHMRSEAAEATAGREAEPEVDEGTRPYELREPERRKRDEGDVRFSRLLSGFFNYAQDVSEALGRGEDPEATVAKPKWVLRRGFA
ncbi:hypothetical protein HUA74_18400 [Myxococcus sp. CA051A]|uniref:hypothetical protein n=1 Tax=Myxococcus sp. CA051A TaxID=2741739 RepID=UPI00157B4028|nr:hypothetical protein [Myxococcus sp. CA051A]NTX62626.1 hypothetical protein [Myxococcus sp. CA051A]